MDDDDKSAQDSKTDAMSNIGSVQAEPIQDEFHEIDENKFTPMMYDETEFLIINNIKVTKNGTMDDVFIFEKVQSSEIKGLFFIQSCVPQIKEFSFNLR